MTPRKLLPLVYMCQSRPSPLNAKVIWLSTYDALPFVSALILSGLPEKIT